MHGLLAALARPTTLRRAAFASLAVNVALVITGGAVRLTGSGLGCPTWPRCTEGSYVTTAAMGINGAIEFGNRLLTIAVAAVAVLGVVCAGLARPRRPRTTWLSVSVLLSVPAQAVLGGLTVLSHLNPWVVASHFLFSMAIIAAAYAFWVTTEAGGPATGGRPGPGRPVLRPARPLGLVLAGVSAAVLVAGTVVTGSGPHAGAADARRTGLDPAAVAQVHADLVFLLLGLSVATWLALRAVGAGGAGRGMTRRAGWLLVIVLAQGVIGFVQYATGLPALVVAAHMAGACAVWLGTLCLLRALLAPARPVGPGPDPSAGSAPITADRGTAAPAAHR